MLLDASEGNNIDLLDVVDVLLPLMLAPLFSSKFESIAMMLHALQIDDIFVGACHRAL